ncbi:hypothetical protein Ahy_B10g102374 [Arachis hypogaea]|uniref:CCHC-type domain-containing protein n=1 Tax=Arachis hypogaea TaxID=3818 RepID=A0A444X1Q0_ARAHY|nr:hypothetical protein Ahy_B10g102374 [Arachis hypogaea]
MKRRMNADEKDGGRSKKSKADPKPQSNNGDNVHLKRQLVPFTCSFCGDKGHIKRGCKKKRACDAAAATAVAVEADKKKKNEGGDHGIKRPSKLSPRKRSSPLATSVPVNPMQGASSGTTTKFVNYMKFIPTPGFKAPRKKN